MLRHIYIIFLVLLVAQKPEAQVVSLSQTSSTITVKSLPASKSTWINPNNAANADNAFATTDVQNKRHGDLLIATNWGFSTGNGVNQIPSNAVINGFEVEIKMKGSNNSIRDYIIQLRKNSSITSGDLSRPNSAWPQTLSYVKFGSSTNLWGLTWTAAEIAASTFGVEIAAQGRTSPGTALIDHIKITVFYNLRFYYSKPAGNLTVLSTWGINTDGSGSAPPNFTDSGQIFNFRNRVTTTLNADLTIGGQASKLVVGDGTNATALTIPSTAVLNSLVDVSSNGTLNISNTVSPTLQTLENNSAVAYNALANQYVQELTYYHLLLGGSGSKVSGASGNAITVNGNFTINSGTTFNNTDQDLVANGNVINNGTTTGSAFIWMNGITASTISGINGIFGNLKTDNDINVTLSSKQYIKDTLSLTSAGFTTSSFLNMNSGSVIVRDAGTLSSAPVSTNLFDVQYTGLSKSSGVEISGNYIKDFLLSLDQTTSNTLTLSQAMNLNGNMKLDSGTLDVSNNNYNITVFKNIIINSPLNCRSNTLSLTGSSLQSISGTSTITLYKLTLNNAAGLKLLNPIQVNNLLTFTNGLITTDNTNLLTLGSAGTTTGANSARYINGPLTKILATTLNTIFTYPVGAAGLYRPVDLDVTQLSTTPTNYTVEMVNGAPASATLPSTLTSVSTNRFFRVTKGAGSGVNLAFITLSYGAEDALIQASNIRVAKKSGSNWLDLGGAGNTFPSGTVKSIVSFTTFNDFVLADNTSTLPVSILSFKGVISTGTVKLQWLTGNELNIDHYEIEKSKNGINWISAGIEKSTGAAQLQNSYTFTDNNPYAGTGYYRLKIADKNLVFTFSNVISIINNQVTISKIAMFPNVINNKQSMFTATGFIFNPNENISINIYSSNGLLVQKKIYTAQSQISLTFPGLSAGIYRMSAQIKGKNYTSTFIIP